MPATIFDLSTLTPEQREITERAINAVAFDWDLLIVGLQRSKGKSQIPVEWSDISRFNQAAGTEGHVHIEEDEDHAGLLVGELLGRRASLGLAWYSGKITIEQTLVSDPDLAIEVFIAEGAHMVDFFFMKTDQKRAIFNAYHPGMTPEEASSHGHDWFDDVDDVGDPNVQNPDYWSWVGESFMSGFLHAYADGIPTPLEARQPWAHRTTPEIAAAVREILTPAPAAPKEFLTSRYGTLIHTLECSRGSRIKHRILITEWPANKKACTYCNPQQG